MSTQNNKTAIGAGILTALAASLCCITPVLAFIAGASGMASAFSWLEPARPYFMGGTALILGFAWYQKLKPKKAEVDCDCEEEKTSFWQTKSFLGIVTVFAGLMLAFPHYSHVFYPDNSKEVNVVVDQQNIFQTNFSIEGMTCTGCENHIIHAVNELEGIMEVKASYEEGNAMVRWNKSKTSLEAIEQAINATGYKAVDHKTS